MSRLQVEARGASSERMMIERLENRRLLAAATFTYDLPPGTANPHSLRFDLDQAQLPAQVLVRLTNLTSSEAIHPIALSAGSWGGGASAIVTFPGYTTNGRAGVLPDRNYYAVIVDRARPPDQQILLQTEFFAFGGDANHDRIVNSTDFNILASNFGQSPRTFSQGDFNYDGTVNSTDFNILAGVFGSPLAAPTVSIKLTGTPVSTEEIDLYWSPVGSADSYRVEVSLEGMEFFDSGVFPSTAPLAFAVGLFPSQTFSYRVIAMAASSDIGMSNLVRSTSLQPASRTPLIPPRPQLASQPLSRSGNKLLIAFNGAYVTTTLESSGNRWFEARVEEDADSIKPNQANNSSAYRFDTVDINIALGDLLGRIDTDGNQVITGAEANASKIVLMGYSWGAINAANFTIRLKEDNIIVRGTVDRLYHLQVDIPVKLLLTLDPLNDGPAWIFRHVHGKIDTNVERFINYYQRRGGTATFDLWNHSNQQTFSPFAIVTQGSFGTFFSSFLKGKPLSNRLAAANVSQVNISTLGARLASNYQWSTDPLNPFVTQYDTDLPASRIEHLGLPWYVRGGTNPSFPSDYNVLSELANV